MILHHPFFISIIQWKHFSTGTVCDMGYNHFLIIFRGVLMPFTTTWAYLQLTPILVKYQGGKVSYSPRIESQPLSYPVSLNSDHHKVFFNDVPSPLLVTWDRMVKGVWSSVFRFRKLGCVHASSLQSCPTQCDPMDYSQPDFYPWGSPGKNTGVGCHFLLQKILVTQE